MLKVCHAYKDTMA